MTIDNVLYTTRFIFLENYLILSFIYSLKACGKDSLPPKMTKQCRALFSCAKLAKLKRCDWKFRGSLNANCKKTLTKWQQNAVVKTYCRRSCQNCVGRCSYLDRYQQLLKIQNMITFTI